MKSLAADRGVWVTTPFVHISLESNPPPLDEYSLGLPTRSQSHWKNSLVSRRHTSHRHLFKEWTKKGELAMMLTVSRQCKKERKKDDVND